ncbi:hypothetical protein ACFQRB_10335 [Halobaculum litoreum]|uniref:Uncharacterized protein n=1 Tax=Halobaculum litoreum TaxID=3031998 RepID=A0ABD5XUQ6_9EURY
MTRAQSDAIGFVLVFSLIVLTVGTVYAAGYPALQDLRSDEQLENMERAFEVLDDNVDDMAREGAPSRATEIKLNGECSRSTGPPRSPSRRSTPGRGRT